MGNDLKAEQDAVKPETAAEPVRSSLLDNESSGGPTAIRGFDFQRRYALILLLASLSNPEWRAVLVEGAEDVEVLFDRQGRIEIRAIQLKNYRVTTALAREIVGHFKKLDDDSTGTWKDFVIACAELDDRLKTIHNGLERYRPAGRFYSADDAILANTRVDLERRIKAAKLPVEFVLDRVTFEPDSQSYNDDSWVQPRALSLLQKSHPSINRETAEKIYMRLKDLVWESTGRSVERQQVEEIISAVLTMQGDASGRHDFYRLGHNDLPTNYIPRPELLTAVREQLLVGVGDQVLTAASQAKQVHVLHGMGGIGKSVLARALCDDPQVQATFPDGILWVTLGQTPDLPARLRAWIEKLDGTISQTAPTLDTLRETLTEKLADKACLLIVDDACQKAHLQLFNAGGPRCRLLLTARREAIAENLDTEIYPIPVMSPDQAVALLEEWAQGKLAVVEAQVKAKIVKRLGYLPLALRLAGTQLRQKDPAEWLASFDVRKLKSRLVETEHDSLEQTFAMSLDSLTPTDRRLYVGLAIFKEDEATPIVAIARLWSELDGRDADEVDYLLDDLAERALLERKRGDSDAVRIHDLLRDFMAIELGEEGHTAAHRGVLTAYRKTQQGIGWHTVPDDGYIFDHLAYHLDQLADHDPAAATELHDLFVDQNWLHSRVQQSDYRYDGYLVDLTFAWDRAHAEASQQIDTGHEPVTLAQCMRYALIRTSINSLAGNYDPSLVARAVETGVWPVERALSVAAMVPARISRVEMLLAIVGTGRCSDEARVNALNEALTAALAIDWERSRAEALVSLAPQLSGELEKRALQAGLAAVRSIGDEGDRAQVLAALAPKLSGELREQALQEWLLAVQAIRDEWARAEALVALAPQLSGELLQGGLAAARAIGDDGGRATALAALAPQLSGELREQALQEWLLAVQAIRDEWDRAVVLAALAPQLGEELLWEGLAAAQGINFEAWRAKALVALAPQLSGELLREELATAQAIGWEMDRAEVLVALAPQLSGELLREGLAAAQSIRDELARAKVLAALMPQLSVELLQEGLAAAQAIGVELARALAQAASMEQLLQGGLATAQDGESYCAQALATAQAIVATAQAIGVEYVRALAALAPQLSEEVRERTLREGLAVAQAIGDEGALALALEALATQLSGELLREWLETARTIGDGRLRAMVLAVIALQLSEELREQAVQEAQAIGDEGARAKALAQQLSEELREQALREALAAAQAIGDEGARAKALAALAAQLSGGLLAEGLAAVRAIDNEYLRTTVLRALAPQLSGELLREGLAAAQAIESFRAEALAALAPQLNGELLREALAAAQAIDDGIHRAWALVTLAWQLNGELKERALREGLMAAQAIDDDYFRAQALAALVAQLSGELKERALREGLMAAQAIDDEHSRVHALASLVPQLSGEQKEQSLQEWLAAAQATGNEGAHALALAALAPELSGELKERVLAEGLVAAQATTGNDYVRAEALAALAWQLSGELKEQALQQGLAAAQAISDERGRAQRLAALAPELSGELLREGLAMVRAFGKEEFRAEALATLASQLSEEQLLEGIVFAQGISHEGFRAGVLAALTPRLSGKLREQALGKGLAAAQAIGDEYHRAWALAAFLPSVEDQKILLGHIRQAMANHLRYGLQNEIRRALLSFCSEETLFAPPVLNSATLATITKHIIEICREWEWM